MSEWKEYKLCDAIKFGNGKVRPNSSGSIPVYGGNGILDFCNESNYVDETIIIGRVGAYCGAVYYENKPIWVSDNALAAKPKEKFHTKFLYYFLKNLALNNFAEGSSHPLVTQTLLNAIDVCLTDDIYEQRAIASILSSIDDKIDLLHCQNKTLEAMAETLFRQWFVEEVQDSWQEYKLKDISNHRKDNVKPQQNGFVEYAHFSIPAFDNNKRPINELGTEIKSNKYSVFSNTILISKLNPRFPRVWALFGEADENSICSTEFQVVVPRDINYFGFIYCLLNSKQVTDELIGAAGGTSGSHQRVKPEDIFNISFMIPNKESMVEFNTVVIEFIKKIKSNYEQIRTLEKLRDTLLPKLMSGEVRVKI
ncbi:MAG: restriction endonuclease subunit S [Ignavibacteria bacterium]|nr:restriction endonuclease subunit S [Bacteroidota bacterium]MBL7128827.1 restriction endonuclease subunit S [Ignavibacteria bacterium]